MKKLLILFYLVIQSCGSYTFTTNKGYEVKSILAITEVGDTISVPYRQFVKYRDTEFVRYRYNNSWYWNNWRYNDPYFWNQYYNWDNYRYWNQYRVSNNRYIVPNRPSVRPKVKPKTRPKNPPPRTRPKLREPIERIRVNTPRGSNNQYTPRNTPTPRPTSTPNVRIHTNTRRGSTGGRRNNQ